MPKINSNSVDQSTEEVDKKSIPKTKKRIRKPKKDMVKTYIATQHIWSVQDKMTLLKGIQKYGFENIEGIEKMIGTKDQNEIRFFIENRRISLMRKLKQEESESANGEKRALVEQWSQAINAEVICRYRKNDSSGCIAEIFNHAAQGEPHLQPENDYEPDISAIYRFFGKMVDGIFPSELRPVDSMLALYLIQSLRDVLNIEGLDVERELYSNFQGAKGNANLLTEELPHSSGIKQETDPWEQYRLTDPEIVKKAKEYKRLLQYFNPLHVPGSLLQKETELLQEHVFDME